MADLTRSGEFRRLAVIVENEAGFERDRLLRILLVELSARSRWWRVVETVVFFVTDTFAFHTDQWTRGPLQLANAPHDFRSAVRRGAAFLREVPDTDIALAAAWYGSSFRQQGSAVSYTDALEVARRVLRQRKPDG